MSTVPLSQLFSLEGRTVLVTGSRRGLGLEVARMCATAGAHVVINDLEINEAEASAAALRDQGFSTSSVAFDVTQRDAVRTGIEQVLRMRGRIDGLVNNAGINVAKPFTEYSEIEWSAIMNTHVTGSFNVTQAVLPTMLKQGGGRIVMVSSIAAQHVRGTLAPYAAAKGALASLTKNLASEFGGRGINTNAVAPGFLKTEFTQRLTQNDSFTTWLKERVPLGRWGEPTDVAPAVLFLLSDASSFVNGHVLTIDGGMSAAL